MTNICQQLIDAVKSGSVEEVERLLEQGADVHCTDGEYGLPPIHRIGDKPSVPVVQLLLSHGADVNAMQSEGSPLMMCAYCGYLELAKVLLKNGAEVDLAVPEGGETALHMASVTGMLEVARLLVEAGADVKPSSKQRPRNVDVSRQVMGRNTVTSRCQIRACCPD